MLRSPLGLRAAELWMCGHFLWIAALATAFGISALGAAWALAALVPALFWAVRKGGERLGVIRDWLPLAFTLVAYREMDWFAPARHTHVLENGWIVWDRLLLGEWGLRAGIESLGALLPGYLELCYLIVYAVGPFSIAVLYGLERRDRVPTVLFGYVSATLLAYALFPSFPSEPPRVVFPGMDAPGVETVLRRWNLAIVGGYGIHSSVFPSAHVSSAFGAAWGMMRALPEKRSLWTGMLVYAVSVAVATVYGRYHYAVDAVAGVVVALVTWVLLRLRSSPRLS